MSNITERREILIRDTTKGKVHETKRLMIKEGYHVGEQIVHFSHSAGEWQLTMYTDFKERE